MCRGCFSRKENAPLSIHKQISRLFPIMSIEYTSTGITVGSQHIDLNDIIKKVNTIKIKANDFVLFEIEWAGQVKDSIVLRKADAIELQSALLGVHFFFADLNGKHGHVDGTIEEGDMAMFSLVCARRFLKEHPNGWTFTTSFLDKIADSGGEIELVGMTHERFEEIVLRRHKIDPAFTFPR
jgi:hypothetical protein